MSNTALEEERGWRWVRGCSGRAEDPRFPLARPVAVCGEAARPHAATRDPPGPLAAARRGGLGAGAAPGLAWSPASNRAPAVVRRRGSPCTLVPASQPSPGRRLLMGLGTQRAVQGCLAPAEPPARAAAAPRGERRSADQMPRLLPDVQPARDFSPPTSFHRAQ